MRRTRETRTHSSNTSSSPTQTVSSLPCWYLLLSFPLSQTPRYSVSEIVGKIKANTSREVRKQFGWVKKMYWRNEFWSPGFFSSTVGIDEEVIKRYVEFQERVDKGKMPVQLTLGF